MLLPKHCDIWLQMKFEPMPASTIKTLKFDYLYSLIHTARPT